MYIVDKIIERAERSANDWKDGSCGNRNMKIDQRDYDIAGRSGLNEELLFLQENQLAKVKWWSKPHEAISISYRLENLPDFYEIKRNAMAAAGDDSFETKQQKIERFWEMLQKEMSLNYESEWITNYYEWLLQKLNEGKLAADLDKIEEYLPVFRGLDHLKEPILKTEFSENILQNPKKFQREMEKHIITLARNYSDEIGKDISDKEMLEHLLLEEDKLEMDFKKIAKAGYVNKYLFHPTEDEYEHLLEMYEAVECSTGTTKAVGDALENFVKALFGCCDAFTTGGIHTATNQIDCCVHNKMHLKYGILNTIGGHFYIECKNEKRTPSGGVITKLESIISEANPAGKADAIKFGIIISKEKGPETFKQHAVKAYLTRGIVIIAIYGEELKHLLDERGNLLDLIERKVFEITGDVKSDVVEVGLYEI